MVESGETFWVRKGRIVLALKSGITLMRTRPELLPRFSTATRTRAARRPLSWRSVLGNDGRGTPPHYLLGLLKQPDNQKARKNRTLGTLKVCFALEYANGLLESLVLWCAFGLQVITSKEPQAERPTL